VVADHQGGLGSEVILGSISALAVIARSVSDEAIQTLLNASGLLRFARNDDSIKTHHALGSEVMKGWCSCRGAG
jgi:hypothetical protein